MRAALVPWALRVSNMQTRAGPGEGDHGPKVNTAKVTHKDEDEKEGGKISSEKGRVDGEPGTMPKDNQEGPEAAAGRLAAVRERIRDAGVEVREDAKDWIREKRGDMDEMREVWQYILLQYQEDSTSLMFPRYLSKLGPGLPCGEGINKSWGVMESARMLEEATPSPPPPHDPRILLGSFCCG